MKSKKNIQSNLEKKRFLYFEIGILVSLSLLLLAFETGSRNLTAESLEIANYNEKIIEEIMPVTRPEQPKLVPPIMPKEIIIIKDTEAELDDPNIDWNPEIDPNAALLDYKFPDETKEIDDIPFINVQKMPRYHNGDQSAFQKHLQKLVVYPEEAQNANIKGRVYLEFVVDENGHIIMEKVIKSPHPSLSEAVLEALKKTDPWQPGEQRDKKVKVRFIIPINFTLNN